MRTLLFINSPSRDKSKHFPFGPAILTSVLKANSIDYDIFDGNFSTDNDLTEMLQKNEYAFIAISGIITTYQYQKRIIKLAREYNPQCIIISGGGLASAVGEDLLKLITMLDICSIGEGEKSILDIIHNYKNQPTEIKGIIFRNDNILYHNTTNEPIQDLNALPMPDYEGWNLDWYLEHKPPDQRTSKIYSRKIDILTSRGCAYNCDFCFNLLGRKKVRFRSLDSIIDEMYYLINRYEINYFNFMDENFFIHKKFAYSFAERVKKAGLKFRFAISARTDSIDPELLISMREIGCELIYIGCESGSNLTLQKMNKRCSVENNYNAFIQIAHAHILPVPMLMIGYEGGTIEDIQAFYNFVDFLANYGRRLNDEKTKNFIRHGIKNILPIYYATPYPGSQLYERNKNNLPSIETVLTLISNKDARYLTLNLSAIADQQLIKERDKLEKYIQEIKIR